MRIATRWSETSRRVRLTVSDAGTGFPAHILQRAFEPYVTTKPRGTGLGLAVVKKIADEHGARIDLSNRVEDGVVRGHKCRYHSRLKPPWFINNTLHAARSSIRTHGKYIGG